MSELYVLGCVLQHVDVGYDRYVGMVMERLLKIYDTNLTVIID